MSDTIWKRLKRLQKETNKNRDEVRQRLPECNRAVESSLSKYLPALKKLAGKAHA
jgi:hypothetical protein